MNFGGSHYSTEWLRRADAVARAVNLWVKRRSLARLCEGIESCPASERGFAGGLLEGLAVSMELSQEEYQAAAYSYVLLSSNETDVLEVTRQLLDVATDQSVAGSYLDGLADADSLCLGMRLTKFQSRRRPDRYQS